MMTEEAQVLAKKVLDHALLSLADKEFEGDERKLRDELNQGSCRICAHLTLMLSEEIAREIAQTNPDVVAIYRYELETVKRAMTFADQDANSGDASINLLVVVTKKTAEFRKWLTTFTKTLIAQVKKIGCRKSGVDCFTIDFQVADETHASGYRTFGLLTKGLTIRSVPLWKQDSTSKSNPIINLDEHVLWQHRILESIDLELTPEHSLFERASHILSLPQNQREYLEHELRDIKVNLIRKLISDQLPYINLAKEWLTFADLEQIYRHRIGSGKIGGKSAGLILAYRILQEVGDENLKKHIHVPESYYLGSDLIYVFMAMNGLMHWNNQKYKPEESIRTEYPQIMQEFEAGNFPPEILSDLRLVLEKLGKKPLIVRSSSQLEDNFGTSFAGKYDSFFCPNQGNPEQNLSDLVHAISKTYASILKPDALLYRRSKALQDYDERMAILIQVVEGDVYGDYFLPFASGVAFGKNLYRWAPQIRREDGFTRMVWGLGTRAVDRVGNDYPHLVALSHPLLQPDDSPGSIRYYSQQFVDLIDLKDNSLKTLPVKEALSSNYPYIRHLVQIEEEGYFVTPKSRVLQADIPRISITFDELLRRTKFANLLSQTLRLLDEKYHMPVDMEYTLTLQSLDSGNPEAHITLLQCRPQSRMLNPSTAILPKDIPEEKIAFRTSFMVPQGYLAGIQYVLFITPEGYRKFSSTSNLNLLTRTIQKLNNNLGDKKFICVGPGRWGTSNPELGVFVTYADIFHAAALIELSGKNVGVAPEPSLGTHFFQDLMEAQIFPLSINLDKKDSFFNQAFFYRTPNHLIEFADPQNKEVENCLRVIAVSDFLEGCHLDIIMDDEKNLGIALFSRHN